MCSVRMLIWSAGAHYLESCRIEDYMLYPIKECNQNIFK